MTVPAQMASGVLFAPDTRKYRNMWEANRVFRQCRKKNEILGLEIRRKVVYYK